jgi:sulfonate transport system substrate-binding protein
MRLAPLLLRLFFGSLLLAAPAHTRAQTVDIDVAYLPLLGSTQLFVMESEGWAKEAGINMTLTRFNSGTAIVQALASGKFDVVIMAISPVIVARAAGIDLKIVAAMHDIDSHAFIGVGGLADAYGKTSSPAEAFAKFHKDNGRAAKIATLPKGTLPDTAVRYYLEHNKVGSAHFQILNQGEEQVLQSILAGAAEAVSLAEPLMTIIKQKISTAKMLAAGRDLMPGHPGFVFSIRERFIARDPATTRKLVQLNKRATELIKADPRRAAQSALKFIGRGLLDEDLMTAAVSSPFNPVAHDPKIIVSGTEMMQDFQLKIGAQARKVPTGELFDFRFVE